MRRIIQIERAEVGWRAAFAVEVDGQRQIVTGPLALWGLYESTSGPEPMVAGLTADLDGLVHFADECENFLGYLAPGEDVAEIEPEAVVYWERRGAKK